MENFEKNSMIFYKSFYEMAQEMNQKDRFKFYETTINYGLKGLEPDYEKLSSIVKMAFISVKPQIEANHKRYVNGCKGGAPKNNQNATKKQPSKTTKNNQKQPNENENENENENVNENVAHARDNTPPFPPSLTDIEQYKKDAGLNNFDCKKFYDHYESCGWKTHNGEGKPLDDWKQAARVWNEKEYKNKSVKSKGVWSGMKYLDTDD